MIVSANADIYDIIIKIIKESDIGEESTADSQDSSYRLSQTTDASSQEGWSKISQSKITMKTMICISFARHVLTNVVKAQTKAKEHDQDKNQDHY